MDKIAMFLQENEGVAAHHRLCSQNPAWAPRVTPISLTVFALFGRQASGQGRREQKGAQKPAVEGPVETHGFTLGTWDRWILPMEADTVTRVWPWVCPEELCSPLGRSSCLGNLSGVVSSPTFFFCNQREQCEMGLKPLSLH